MEVIIFYSFSISLWIFSSPSPQQSVATATRSSGTPRPVRASKIIWHSWTSRSFSLMSPHSERRKKSSSDVEVAGLSGVSSCQPSCCPRLSCSLSTCPGWFKRHRSSPPSCPSPPYLTSNTTRLTGLPRLSEKYNETRPERPTVAKEWLWKVWKLEDIIEVLERV